jgi:phosphate-selective porin OprO/OprP
VSKHIVAFVVPALVVLVSTALVAAQPTPPPEPQAPPPVAVEPAVKLETTAESKKLPLELKPGGYVHVDQRRLLTESEAHEMTVRRLRFKLDGSATKLFRFRTLIDFAGSKVTVNDAWAEAVIVPELSIRAGKDKSQFGIERLQSATQLTFIERAYPTQLAPNRDIGIWVRGDVAGSLVHYAAGVVDGVANNAVIEGESDDVLEFNVHLLVSPFANAKHLGDLGIGAATTFGNTKGVLANPGLTNIRSAAQATIVKFAAAMDADATARVEGRRTRFAGHAYYYGGPIGVLAEYVRDREHVTLMGTTTLIQNAAWQLAASVAVTPGDRPTARSIKPKQPFDPAKGTWGAVELAGRYSELRLDPDSFGAGITSETSSVERAREVTLGGNWYFNEYLKLQLDYSLTTFDSTFPTEHLVATRLQASI